MGKYDSLEKDIYSIFSSMPWSLESIATFPNNVFPSELTEYIRVNIVASGEQIANSLKSVSGILIIDIFFPVGGGNSRATIIADKLDTYLSGKTKATTLGGSTQLLSSTLVSMGVDKANANLFRYIYTIPFNYYGV